MNRTFAVLLLAASLSLMQAASYASTQTRRAAAKRTTKTASGDATVLDLRDFGAVGDGSTDDAPALQAALDALADAGGGTLFVPAGRYALASPVARDFSGVASSITISGVESSTQVNTKGGGDELTKGLDLTSEFVVRVGDQSTAIQLSGLDSLLVNDVAFSGVPAATTDARISLALYGINAATIRHCEFYALSSLVSGGAVLHADYTDLKIENSAFLGCTANSGLYTPVILNTTWKGFTMTGSVMMDYGQRPDSYGKLGYAGPVAWVTLGNTAPATNLSPRREAVVRDVFLDEGGYYGVASLPYLYPASAPADLVAISDLRMNVSSLGASGLSLRGLRRAVVERAQFGLSRNADSAISFVGVGDAVVDLAECGAAADSIRADYATGKLTVVNSTYAHLYSQAATTDAYTTDAPEDDAVQHTRQRYADALAAEPDAAGLGYWSARFLACGADADCRAQWEQDLTGYLGASPAPRFSITGQLSDEYGAPMANVAVALSGSQSVAATTGADGSFAFADLPTSGAYTVTPARVHYTFDQPSLTVVTPADDAQMSFDGTVNRYRIYGSVVDAGGRGVAGATVELSGALADGTAQTDAGGNYTFNAPAEGDYSVTVSRVNYTFSQPQHDINFLASDTPVGFTGTLLNYKIGGHVTEGSAALVGATVTLTGSRPATATTDANGSYSFTLPAEGDYTVAVTKAHYTFATAQKTFASLGGDQTADFSGTLNHHTLGGHVTQPGGQPLAGATVALSGAKSATATTDAAGAYSFANLAAGGTYTVTPSKTDYSFQSPSRSFADLGADQTADFTASLVSYAITGRVTEGTAALAGVAVTLAGSKSATATTDAGGNYSFTVQAQGDYTVTPAKAHYTFTPQSAAFRAVSGGDKRADFGATLNRHSISVRATDSTGAPLAAATLTLTGAQTLTAQTDANGAYTFASLPAGGNYAVAASKNHYTFAAASVSFNDLGADQTASFVGALNSHAISGRVADANNR
ncbi:MAG: carboxypeptidase regulatory-like domain-containing protein, partial [Acidobacteria bacterium]|nr:carboxypeptidase regulatory-like domain-containing protein [Acidobacteriota bacterium]